MHEIIVRGIKNPICDNFGAEQKMRVLSRAIRADVLNRGRTFEAMSFCIDGLLERWAFEAIGCKAYDFYGLQPNNHSFVEEMGCGSNYYACLQIKPI